MGKRAKISKKTKNKLRSRNRINRKGRTKRKIKRKTKNKKLKGGADSFSKLTPDSQGRIAFDISDLTIEEARKMAGGDPAGPKVAETRRRISENSLSLKITRHGESCTNLMTQAYALLIANENPDKFYNNKHYKPNLKTQAHIWYYLNFIVKDPPLSNTGLCDLINLYNRYYSPEKVQGKDSRPIKVYCSCMCRAIMTALILYPEGGKDGLIHVVPWIHEQPSCQYRGISGIAMQLTKSGRSPRPFEQMGDLINKIQGLFKLIDKSEIEKILGNKYASQLLANHNITANVELSSTLDSVTQLEDPDPSKFMKTIFEPEMAHSSMNDTVAIISHGYTIRAGCKSNEKSCKGWCDYFGCVPLEDKKVYSEELDAIYGDNIGNGSYLSVKLDPKNKITRGEIEECREKDALIEELVNLTLVSGSTNEDRVEQKILLQKAFESKNVGEIREIVKRRKKDKEKKDKEKEIQRGGSYLQQAREAAQSAVQSAQDTFTGAMFGDQYGRDDQGRPLTETQATSRIEYIKPLSVNYEKLEMEDNSHSYSTNLYRFHKEKTADPLLEAMQIWMRNMLYHWSYFSPTGKNEEIYGDSITKLYSKLEKASKGFTGVAEKMSATDAISAPLSTAGSAAEIGRYMTATQAFILDQDFCNKEMFSKGMKRWEEIKTKNLLTAEELEMFRPYLD